MLIVAGLNLRNLQPRVWDRQSPHYLPQLRAVMVSYADFERQPNQRKAAMRLGLRRFLGVAPHVKVFLDNGAFWFLRRGGEPERRAYRTFVRAAEPDWYPIPFDAIPTPTMPLQKQRQCLSVTMRANSAHRLDGYVPVLHVSRVLEDYIDRVKSSLALSRKTNIALGGIVPNLLRAPKAVPHTDVLTALRRVRQEFPNKKIHVFGVGGTATVHIAAILGVDSVDSSGWRNRAARGIVQLPGCGDRTVIKMGSWRGRAPSTSEWAELRACDCPACSRVGIRGLKAKGMRGFSHRATHNLHVLLAEAEWIRARMRNGSYERCFARRLRNSIYSDLVREAVRIRNTNEG